MKPWSTTSGRLPSLRWSVAHRPLSGESVSGDHHLVAPFEGGALLAVVDALGHGSEAEFAARLAVATMSTRRESPVEEILKDCHRSLAKTRGIAVAIASIDFRKSRLSWVAIGNVEGLLVPGSKDAKRQAVIQHGGIVGYQMPKLPPIESVKLVEGDRLCFATDGIKSSFMESITVRQPLETLAATVLEKFENVRDDALVLIAEFGGER